MVVLFSVHLQSYVIAKAVLVAAHSLPLCNFSQNKVAVMTWRAWVMCSCISTWARCPGRASRLPPSAKSTRGSARKRCQRPSRCSAKGTLVSALILMAVLSAAWLVHLVKPLGILNPKGPCPIPRQGCAADTSDEKDNRAIVVQFGFRSGKCVFVDSQTLH